MTVTVPLRADAGPLTPIWLGVPYRPAVVMRATHFLRHNRAWTELQLVFVDS